MKRGEIYYIEPKFDEQGSEQRAGRPAVIVSNNKNNKASTTVEVIYMTTKPKNDLPTHVTTRSTGMLSTIICEQVSTVSVERVGRYIGQLTESEIINLDTALAISLGIDFGSLNAAPVMREPTKEELEKLIAETRITLEPFEPTESIVRLETERDLYRTLYNELLDNLMKGARVQ